MSLLFIADNHYGTHAGRILHELLRPHFPISFHEDEWSALNHNLRKDRHPLLILHAISGTSGVPMPPPEAEDCVKKYLEGGGNLLLLHGSSAAFWQWAWWRRLVGLRWVRRQDPDGCLPSHHPIRSYTAQVVNSGHPLGRSLQDVDIPEDEMYMKLEQTRPVTTLMMAKSPEGAFPMCWLCPTPWGGKLAGYLPGHDPKVAALPGNVENVRALIGWLLGSTA